MKRFCIGLFDSGVGGIKVLERVVSEYPNFDFVYLFDKSGLPYGSRSTQELNVRALNAVKFLENKGCDIVIIACNTQTIASLDYVKERTKIKVYGVLPPIERAVIDGYKRILVMATPYTIKHVKEITYIKDSKVKLIYSPQPYLAEIVENNLHKKDIIFEHLKRSIIKYKDNIDSVVLGCTHYYYIKNYVEEILKVKAYDGIDFVLNQIRSGCMKTNDEKRGKVKFFYS